MRKVILIISLVMSFMIGTVHAAEWVNISGNVYYGSQRLNVMILANGQHMFTDPADGRYDMSVPLNDNGEIILFSFCDGLAPFKQILTPQEAEYFEVRMEPAPDSKNMDIVHQMTLMSSGWIKIRGAVQYNGTPLCAMVLANGEHTFSSVQGATLNLKFL